MGGRLRFGRVLSALGLAALLGGAALAGSTGPSGSTRAPIEAQVLRQMATEGHASFWIVLRGQADVSAASRIHDRATRGEVVYKWRRSVWALIFLAILTLFVWRLNAAYWRSVT